MGEFVRLEVDEASRVATIRLDRPPVNALNAQVQDELREAAGQAAADGRVGAVVLWGGEKVFAAGADIKEMAGRGFAEISARTADLQAAFTAIARVPKVVIAAVTGYALGGGCELALTADFRFAAEDARFGQPEILLGIIPGAGGTQRLPRAVPLAKAMEMILMARTLTAEEALHYGLVNAVVPLPELMPTARKWAEAICELGPLAVRAAKEAILRGLTMPQADGLRLEAFLSGTLRGTEDAVEGPKAFAEKRKPAFRAR